jgi:hypothetical protein
VTPPIACVAPNEDETFTAEVTGVDDEAVDWSWEGPGSLTDNVYTAPGTAGVEATVIATSVERPRLQGTASVLVGECRCAWTATLTGDFLAEWSGDYATWSAGQPGTTVFQFYPDGSETLPSIVGSLDRVIEPGATGTYELFSMQVFDGTAEGTFIGPTETIPAPTMVILSNDGVKLEGYITGVLAGQSGGAEPRLVDLTMSFSAAEITSNGGLPCRAD